MPRTSRAIVALGALLVLTNLAWLYVFVDSGVSYSYLSDAYRSARGAALQSFAVIAASARSDSTRDEIVAAALKVEGSGEPFEKDGYLWVGFIGLKFDATGRPLEAVASTDPF